MTVAGVLTLLFCIETGIAQYARHSRRMKGQFSCIHATIR
jgi:hypothetical protein